MKPLKIALSKGNLFKSTVSLLKKSGIGLSIVEKNHKPRSTDKNLQFFIIKPRDIPHLVENGMVDAGIVGLDIIKDERVKVELLLDLKTMPVFLVLATDDVRKIKKDRLRIASEYLNVAKDFFKSRGKGYSYIKTNGATECFAGEFADAIVEHIQTGDSLKANNLKIVDILMRSSTYLIGNKELNNEKKALLTLFMEKISKGVTKIDTSYRKFLTEEEIRKEISKEI